jgi:hypothetical protein
MCSNPPLGTKGAPHRGRDSLYSLGSDLAWLLTARDRLCANSLANDLCRRRFGFVILRDRPRAPAESRAHALQKNSTENLPIRHVTVANPVG